MLIKEAKSVELKGITNFVFQGCFVVSENVDTNIVATGYRKGFSLV